MVENFQHISPCQWTQVAVSFSPFSLPTIPAGLSPPNEWRRLASKVGGFLKSHFFFWKLKTHFLRGKIYISMSQIGQNYLVGGWTNPSEKYQSKWESSPNRGENQKIVETTTQLSTRFLVKTSSKKLDESFVGDLFSFFSGCLWLYTIESWVSRQNISYTS